MIPDRRYPGEEARAGTNEGNQAGVSVRRDRPQELDPIVKTFRQGAQDVTAANQNMKRRGAAAFEKVDCSAHQPQGLISVQFLDGGGQRKPRIGSYPSGMLGECSD